MDNQDQWEGDIWRKMPSKSVGEKKEEEKEGRRLQFLPPLKTFAAKHQGTEKKKNQSSDKAQG